MDKYLKREKTKNIRIKLTLLFVFLNTVISTIIFSQNSNLSNDPLKKSAHSYHPLKFTHLSLEQGLSDVSVNCILQDSTGFMWFGTDDGLNKYDGYNFTVYRHNPDDSLSLRDNIIEAVYEDKSGVLWIGTLRGWLERFDCENDQFTHYQLGSHVFKIFEDSEGTFWIGTLNPGLLRFDPATGDTTLVWKGRDFQTIFEDREGTLWAASRNEGLGRYNRRLDKFEIIEKSPSLTTIYQDRSGIFWCGSTNGGLIQYNPKTDHLNHFYSDKSNQDILSNEWIVSIVEGVRYNNLDI